jgi:hypothetical protein
MVTPATEFACCAAAGIEANALPSKMAAITPTRTTLDIIDPDYAFPPSLI